MGKAEYKTGERCAMKEGAECTRNGRGFKGQAGEGRGGQDGEVQGKAWIFMDRGGKGKAQEGREELSKTGEQSLVAVMDAGL